MLMSQISYNLSAFYLTLRSVQKLNALTISRGHVKQMPETDDPMFTGVSISG